MKKTNIDLYLKNKKYVKPHWFISFVYHLIYLFETPKYKIHYIIKDDIKKEKGPCFIIFNHSSRADHFFLHGVTYPKPCVNIVGRNEFYRQKFKLVFGLSNQIPKKNYTPDVQTIKAVSTCIKSGGSVIFAPEGLASNFGTNKPIVPETSKMFKHFNIPVYVCRLDGTFLVSTKAVQKERYGDTYATLFKLFTPEDTQKLSVEEMDDKVNEAIHFNAYEWNKKEMHKYELKNEAAKNLEYFLYKCPKCHTEYTMESKGNDLYCTKCGNGTSIDDYYLFHPYEKSVIPENPVEWVVQERGDLIKEIRSDKNYSFSDECEIGNLDPTRYIKTKLDTTYKVGKGKFIVDHNGVHYIGTRNNEPFEFHVPYTEIYTTITFNDAKYFSFYVKGELFDIFPSNKTTGKFIILIEEMHRYHINYYKNFKQYDYLYEGLELGIDNK